jgi:YD repeat-containing protein
MTIANRIKGMGKRLVILIYGIHFTISSSNVIAQLYPIPPYTPDSALRWVEFAIDYEDAKSKCIEFVASLPGYTGSCSGLGDVDQGFLNYYMGSPGFDAVELGMQYISAGWVVGDGLPSYIVNVFYSPTNFCPSPYIYNRSTRMCEALCAAGDTWNAPLKHCESDPTQHNECTKTAHPIDLVDGAKYRRESVMSIGTSFPIELIFHYNNFRNREKTVQGGRRPLVASDDYNISVGSTHNRIVNYYVADQMPPIIAGDPTIDLYNEWGILATEETIPAPYRGDSLRYWRHNYDESLVPRADGTNTWLQSNGEDIEFNAAGKNPIYPGLSLTEVSATEYGFSGYKLRLSNGLQKVFDDRGRLRRVINANGIYHDLQYNDDDLLIRINHSLNGYLDLSYTHYEVSSIYANGHPERPHLSQVTDSAGRHVDISWEKAFSNDIPYYVINSLTAPYTAEPASVREFRYSDPRWENSLTDIYDTYDGVRHHYAHFEYDEYGRAVLSQLVNDVDKVTVEYTDDLTRVITNALGKQSTYRFALFNGVKRLASVTGESTSQCHQSDTAYTYDDSGNIIEKNVNSVITQYQYNSDNLETRRTEAAGTSSQRVVYTTWDYNLRQPVTISYPNQTINYVYDDEGRLISRTVTPR